MPSNTNNLTSNVTRQLARVFLEKFDTSRVLTKTVNTQLLSGKFSPKSGSTVDFKRPHDFFAIETSDGDISGASAFNDLEAGKATGTVQSMITIPTSWDTVEEALELDQLDQILAPMATRAVTQLELNLGSFMIENLGLSVGDPDQPVDAWADISKASAKMKALGVPQDGMWSYVMNPFTQSNLAGVQQGLSSGKDSLVDSAWMKAQISPEFAGFNVLTSSALKTYTSGTCTDRAGAVVGVPTQTYVGAKDTMTMSLAVDGLTTAGTIVPGEVLEFDSIYQLNLSTREPMIDATGAKVKYRCTVVTGVTLSSGAGTITVTGPAIAETNGQYNTIETAIADNDTFTILGTGSTLYQPNLFYHKQAIGLGTVKLPKLYSTDTIATTEDGFSLRVSKYSDGDANKQTVRFDLLPAFACFNPFFGGQGFGHA